jgi:DNA-binding protein HU-beta
MTQSEIVQALAEKCEVTKKVSQGLLAALSETAISEVKKNGIFVLPGIGRLVRVDRKARMGRNPATGEAIKIAAKKVVKFRIAKAAKEAIVPPKKAKAEENLKRCAAPLRRTPLDVSGVPLGGATRKRLNPSR